MKRTTIFALLLIVCICLSCSRGDKTKVVIEKSTAEKIQLPEKLKVTIDLRNIRSAIIAFQTNNQRLPESLDELSIELNYADEYEYDAQTGEVKSKNFPNL